MNITTLTNDGFSARLFAGITMLSLLLSAFPVAFFVANAATGVDGESFTIDATSGAFAATADTTGLSNIVLSFNFDGSTLEGVTGNGSNDPVTLNYSAGSESGSIVVSETNETGTVTLSGLAEDAALAVSISAADVSDFVGDDAIELTNITVAGTAAPLPPAGDVRNVNDNIYFATIQEALDAATTADGETIELLADILVPTEVNFTKSVVFDGGNNTISASFTLESTSGANSVLQVSGRDDVVIRNVTIDGAASTNLHGINLFNAQNIEISNVTINNMDRSGIVVNGAEADVSDLTTSGNGWNAINVDITESAVSAGASESVLNIAEVSEHAETTSFGQVGFVAHIWVDEISKPITVNDLDNQYTFTDYPADAPQTLTRIREVPTARAYVLNPEELKKVDICHFHQNGFNSINVSVNSIENAHGNHTKDIIPVIAGIYPTGQNLDALYGGFTGAEVLANDCVIPKPVSQCIDAKNLLTNGSFEEPEVTASKKWDLFASVPGWTVTKVSDNSLTKLEIQEDLFDNEAAEGNQYAELDGDHSTRVTQTAATQAGATYELSWAFAGRHNAGGDAQNQMDILVNGTSVATEGPQTDPAGLAASDWTRNAVTFTADSNSTDIAFADLGPSNSYGTYLDDAQLCLVAEPKVADVTMCKYDEAGNGLSGWRLALLGEEVDSLTKNPTALVQTMSAVPAGEYVLKAAGAYKYRGNTGLLADARFSERQAGDPGFGTYPNQPWREASVTTGGLAVQVNDDLGVLWGSVFSPTHVYYGAFSQAVTDDVDFYIWDDAYGDNVGSIDLTLYKGRTGVTGTNGCVTFTDVPYGDYVVEELLQANWTNVSGLGPVQVDAETETFNVINRDPNAPKITVEATKIVCDFEEELPNWGKGNNGAPAEITATTAADWLAANTDTSCRLVDDWQFQWSDKTVSSPNSYNTFLGEAAGWNTFSGSTQVPMSALNGGNIEFREVLTDEYITFSGGNDTKPSAELYCGDDVLNYDNLERVNKPVAGETYHCVAWNVLKVRPPQQCTILSDTNTLVVDTNEYAVATYVHGNWTNDIDDAIWVWATEQVENPTTQETYTFAETFTVDNPTAAVLEVAADNLLLIRVNGVVVLDQTDQNNFTMVQTVDILSALNTTGENLIEFEVTNQAGVDNYRRNPAGVLYRLDIKSPVACEVTTEPAFEGSLAITNPAVNGEVLDGIFTFRADYQDADEDEDPVFWAIRAGRCNGTDVVGNAPASPFHPSTFNPVTGAFETTVDMSTWANGDYCLVVNPREDAPADDLRATRTFTLQNPDVPPQTYRISGFKWDDANGNGSLDEEATISGWTINLLQDGLVVRSTTTDSTGEYYFDVPSGEWTVAEVMEEGWTQTGQVRNGQPEDSESFGGCTFTIPGEQVVDFYTCSFGNQEDETPVNPDPETNPESTTSRSSGGTGTRILRVPAPTPLVLGATTDAPQFCPFLTDYMQMGIENDPMEVMKLQLFLNMFRNMFGGTENPVTGTFGAITDANVKAFQETYRSEILDPWYNLGIVPHNRPTGFVYKTTLWKINSIVCPDSAVLPEFSGESLSTNVALDAAPVQD